METLTLRQYAAYEQSREKELGPRRIALRVDLDSLSNSQTYGKIFNDIVAENPQNINYLIIYSKFDDSDTSLFNDLVENILQVANQLTAVHTLEINSVTLSTRAVAMICGLVNNLAQRMLLTTLRILNCQLGISSTLQVIEALRANTNLAHLDLSGNHCGDGIFSSLDEGMTKFEQNLRSLCFNNNNISDSGLEILMRTLSSQKAFIYVLNLSQNSRITASGLDNVFVTIMNSNRLQDLSLYGCQLNACYWARYLPFIRSLQRLDLSHNLIDDDQVVVLGHSLKYNASVTFLSLSHNRFCGYGVHILQSLLSENACLQSLDISSNPLRDKTVFRTLGLGLACNQVLTSLDLSDCGLTSIDLCQLTGVAFAQNTTLKFLYLEDNFLPQQVRMHSDIGPGTTAALRNSLLSELFPDDISGQDIRPLAETAEIDSVNACLVWTSQIQSKIRASIEVKAIVDVETGQVRPESLETDNIDAFERLMWTPAVVQGSNFYLTPTQLDQEVVYDLQDLYNTRSVHMVYVAYGRSDCIIGSLDIDVHLTYRQLRSRIQAMVVDYLQTASVVDPSELHNYSILSACGDVTDQNSLYQDKSVWADVRHTVPSPHVCLRPANWIKL